MLKFWEQHIALSVSRAQSTVVSRADENDNSCETETRLGDPDGAGLLVPKADSNRARIALLFKNHMP
jgi:hypothetical protein